MIWIDSIDRSGYKYQSYTIYADTKAEVPDTGAETKALIDGLDSDIPVGSILVTASFEIAMLDSTDTWVWKE